MQTHTHTHIQTEFTHIYIYIYIYIYILDIDRGYSQNFEKKNFLHQRPIKYQNSI